MGPYLVSLWYLNIWYSIYALYETLRVSWGVMFIAQYPMGPNSIYPKVYSESSSRPPLQLNCIHKAKNVHCITRQTQMSNRIWVKHVFGGEGGGWLRRRSGGGLSDSTTSPFQVPVHPGQDLGGIIYLKEKHFDCSVYIKISIYKKDVMICW